MKEVNVSICTGTTCYLMGAAHLLDIEDVLDPYVREHTRVCGAHCLGLCHDEANGRPPFVKVGDRIIPNANLNKVLDAVRETLGLEA